ncbi:MAG: hypothetical protein EXR49_06235 [Dehalococcoidia bacterium]|nr:hypothetical protein [Dehalococcoidia bacterium]
MPHLPLPLRLLATPIAASAILVACSGGDASTPAPTITPPPAGVMALSVELSNFKFVSKDITLDGTKAIDLTLHSNDVKHTFTVHALNIDITVDGGQTKTLRLPPITKPGSYKLSCDIAGHEAAGMAGTVTVR